MSKSVKVCTEVTFPACSDGENGNGDNGNGNGDHEARTFAALIGDNENTQYTVTHGLGSQLILFGVLHTATGTHLWDNYTARSLDENTLQLTFAEAPGEESLLVYGHVVDNDIDVPPPVES